MKNIKNIRKVMQVLENAKAPMTATEIASNVKLPVGKVQIILLQLVQCYEIAWDVYYHI